MNQRLNQYQTLLCLGISLSVLSGCQEYIAYAQDQLPEVAVANYPATDYVNNNMLVAASKEHLNMLNIEKVNEAFKNHEAEIAYVLAAAQHAGVPGDIAMIPLVESYYNVNHAVNGNVGIWQMDAVVGQNLSLDNTYWFDGRKDLMQSTDAVITYVKFLYAKLDYDWSLAILAYHSGLQPVLDALNINKTQGLATDAQSLDLDPHAKAYLNKIAAANYLFSQQQLPTASLRSVDFPGQIELDKLAATANMQLSDVTSLNAGFKRPLTDPQGPHRILATDKHYQTLMDITKNPSKLRTVSKASWEHHVVEKNESLSVIAAHYDTSIAEIKRVNHLPTDVIHVKQRLLIPEKPPQSMDPQTPAYDGPGPRRIVHAVSQNETLYHIAKKYHVSIEDLTYWNTLSSPSLKPNQVITVWQYTPTDTAHFYTVKPNDSLTKIARDHKVSVASLKEANHLTSPVIHPKDRLVIPHAKH